MLPKRQHLVPRFLLAGFAEPRRRHAAQTWYFRKGTAPSRTSIANVAVRSRFYARPGERDIESLLGVSEGEYAPRLAELREHPARLSQRDAEQAGDFLALILIRSEQFRDLLDRVFRDAVSDLKLLEHDEDRLATIMRKILDRFPVIPLEMYRRSHGLPNGAPLTENVLADIERRTARFRQGRPGRLLRRLLEQPPTTDELARGTHGVVLEILLAEAGRRQLASRPWTVLRFPDDSLVLGNVGPLTGSADLGDLQPMIGVESGSVVLYPIAHNRLLVSAPGLTLHSIDEGKVNRAIVCMSDWFVARRKTRSVMRLHRLLGSDPAVSEQVEDLRRRETLIEYVLSGSERTGFEPATPCLPVAPERPRFS